MLLSERYYKIKIFLDSQNLEYFIKSNLWNYIVSVHIFLMVFAK